MTTFSTPRQIVLLTVAWAAALYAVDAIERPRAAGSTFTAPARAERAEGTPRLSLWVNHLCCSGCLDDLATALGRFPWMAPKGIHVLTPLPEMGAVDDERQSTPSSSYGSRVDLTVTDLRLVDFVALDRAIRDAGLVAGHMEVSGIAHMRFSADVKHLCCGLCATGARQGLGILASLRASGELAWVDSLSLSRERKSVVAHARYGKTADVAELIAGLSQIGFAPTSVFAILDAEK